MTFKNLHLGLETTVGEEIYGAIQGELLEMILKEAKEEPWRNLWKDLLEGHSFKVSKLLSPKMFRIIEAVKGKLDFNDEVDFYITNNSRINASAFTRLEADQPHIVNINSGIVERLDDDELAFIIGHELGHIISNNAGLDRMLDLIYKEREMPPMLTHRYNFWKRLAELSADRYGFIACPDMGKIISCFFTMASGIKRDSMEIDTDRYLKENQEILENYKNSQALQITTHPINPIRLQALKYFETSDFYTKQLYLKEDSVDELLQEQMKALYKILVTFSNSELDQHMSFFMASAGIILANMDDKITATEIEQIIKELSKLIMYPKKLLNDMIQSETVDDIFKRSVSALININPKYKYIMVRYLIDLSLSDKNLFEKEAGFIYSFGEQIGLSRVEISQMFLDIISKHFEPDIYSYFSK